MNTDLILFDAAGVLFPVNKPLGVALERELLISPDQQQPLWDELYPQLWRGEITDEQFFLDASKLLGVDMDTLREVVFRAFRDDLHKDQAVYEIIEELRSSGYRLALLSDTTEMFKKVRDEQGVYDPFEKLYFSYDIGATKPSIVMYQTVIDDYKIPAERIFFIDDREKNVEGARAAGMRGVVFESAEQLRHSLVQEGILR